jgi:hypothetical protein
VLWSSDLSGESARPKVPFHVPSQPGEGLRLYTIDEASVGKVYLQARLRAKTANGKKVQRQLSVPVETVCQEAAGGEGG